ncbi:RES family NAD+ phosphorylase [Gardnerella vaginalis]|uniref:RES family NAD+ phosphorylase n=1 Tax=Gardnerella vaginalis TaxID=2702 RepID=UPI0023E87C1A|nr:RES family NAD+ phosphorylase [Gardnerella vaginalis]
MKRIAEEISKPIRNHNTLDYIPTQYISDYIKSKGYDGIEYVSVVSDAVKNLAVFNL